ncbi:MAG: hypothetical protein IJC73_05105, partial [Lentisphaeria bacterium]|nr:hypothetical protein [Lentisphaeria bacterium]
EIDMDKSLPLKESEVFKAYAVLRTGSFPPKSSGANGGRQARRPPSEAERLRITDSHMLPFFMHGTAKKSDFFLTGTKKRPCRRSAEPREWYIRKDITSTYRRRY